MQKFFPRKRINEQLKASIKPLCPVLMRGVIEEMKILNATYR
jgi:type I restriction enzyme S subunit